MALRHLEGFEGQREVTILSRLYATATGTITTETGYRGSRSAVGSDNLLLRTVDLLDGAADENVWIVGWAMRLNTSVGLSSGATTFPYLSFRSAAGEQLRVEFIAANESKPGGNRYRLRVMRGATTLASSVETFDAQLTDLAWTYLEFKATIRTSTNGSFSAQFGTRRASAMPITWSAANTGINTANQGADGADRIELSLTQAAVAAAIAVDDIYVCDGSGSVNNDFLGPISIEAIDVSGNGTTVQWTVQGGAASLEDAWNEAATIQTADEDDKRVNAKDVGFIELATLANPVDDRNTPIIGTQMRITGKMEATGTRDVQFFYRKTTGSPAQVGTKIVTFSNTTLITHADTLEEDPNTAAPWVLADVDGLQIGVELDA